MENFKLYKHVYEDAEMACSSMENLIISLKDKDNKIKEAIEDIYKEYCTWKNEAKEKLSLLDEEPKEKNPVSKMMASMGIKKEVKSDNSDSAIADLLIQGIEMGSLNGEKALHAYSKELDKEQYKFLKDFTKFQQKAIEKLKEYL